MDVIIQKLTGEQVTMSSLGIIVQDFNVSSADITPYSQSVEGRPGKIDKGADYSTKRVTVPFIMKAVDHLDYPLLRDEIFGWLCGTDPVYLIEGRRLNSDTSHVWGKRYLVRPTSGFAFDQQQLYGFTEMEFETTGLPFGESTATTLTPFTFADDSWSLSGGEIFRDDLAYEWTNQNSITVYNGGNVEVDPRYMPLVLTFTGASTNLIIKNVTNGSQWKYNGTTTASDTIVINGIRSLKSGLSIVRDTTGELLTLSPGDNQLTVTGASGTFTLSAEFRWYYK